MIKKDNKNGKKISIFIISNNKSLTKKIKKKLNEYKYKTKTFTSGKSIIDYCYKVDSCFLIIDYHLNDITTKELISTLKAIGCNKPFIIIINQNDMNEINNIYHLGAKDYIINNSQFIDLIPNIINREVNNLLNKNKLFKPEKSFHKNQKNFSNIMENIKLLICRFRPDNKIITYVNDAYCNYFNKSNLDLIGKNILKLIPKEEYKNVIKHFKSLNKDNPFMSYEHIVNTPKGLRWQKWTDQILFDDNDQIVEYQLICEDITEQKNTEEKNLLMNSIIQQIYESIIIVDINFNITYINLAALELYGYKQNELIGKPLNILYAESLPKQVKKDIYNKITPGKAWIVVHKNKKKDGSTFLCEFKFSPICDSNSKIYAYAAIQRDLSEQKKAEEKLIQRLRFEETISKISSRFIGKYDIDDSINNSLMDIGKLSGASRAYLFLMKENNKIMDNTHEWCSDNVSPQIKNLKNLSCDITPWWMKKLKNDETILITDISKLPIEAINEKKILEAQDIKSLIVLPLYIDKKLSGFIGFDNIVKTREWSTNDLSILRVASEIIGNALENKIYRDKLINK